MRLYDLINCYVFKEIEQVFLSMYPAEEKNLEKYGRLYYELHNICAVSPSIWDKAYEYIIVRHSTMDNTWDVTKNCIGIVCTLGPSPCESREALHKASWSYILGLNIRYEKDGEFAYTADLSPEERECICAAILYEMTWLGFSEGAIRRSKEAAKHPESHA